MQNPTWYNNQVHGCCNIAVQSCYFIIPWQHVLSCMNMAVDLSWWFQQRCSSLFVHVLMFRVFMYSVPTCMSTTLFKLASSTMLKPFNRQKQAVHFHLCSWESWHVIMCLNEILIPFSCQVVLPCDSNFYYNNAFWFFLPFVFREAATKSRNNAWYSKFESKTTSYENRYVQWRFL